MNCQVCSSPLFGDFSLPICHVSSHMWISPFLSDGMYWIFFILQPLTDSPSNFFICILCKPKNFVTWYLLFSVFSSSLICVIISFLCSGCYFCYIGTQWKGHDNFTKCWVNSTWMYRTSFVALATQAPFGRLLRCLYSQHSAMAGM